jgi:hypothetical protein
MGHTLPVRFTFYAGMEIGRDNGGVVDTGASDLLRWCVAERCRIGRPLVMRRLTASARTDPDEEGASWTTHDC